MSESEVTSCYRHQDRPSGVICQRCDRPICGDCRTQASVGWHCPECTRSGKQQIIRGPAAVDPIVTKAMIGVTTAISVAALMWGGSLSRLEGRPLVEFTLLAPFVDMGEYERLFTSLVVHDGLFSLGIVMYMLWASGREVEVALGRTYLVVGYLVAHLGSSAAGLLVEPLASGTGAFGAAFGLVGMLAVLQRAAGLQTLQRFAPLIAIIVLLSVFGSARASAALLGGFASGAAVALIAEHGTRAGLTPRATVGASVLLGAFFFAASLWAAAQWIDPIV